MPACDISRQASKNLHAVSQTEQWFERVVLGLNLCPFAHAPAKEKRVRFVALVVGEGDCEGNLLALLTKEIEHLQNTPAEQLETTLIVAPEGFEDFYLYSQTLGYLEHWLVAQSWEGFVQIASFHPDYQFSGSTPEDAQNLTNRSPYPVFHLIREASLSAIIDNGADTDAIPARNIARVSALTQAERRELFPYL
ncbi:MAG: DUF1415 domain-containing protein [Marinagarivorans sp.]|nr:DUF1415 domain-containing protein [Marinagarivorans sp.]